MLTVYTREEHKALSHDVDVMMDEPFGRKSWVQRQSDLKLFLLWAALCVTSFGLAAFLVG